MWFLPTGSVTVITKDFLTSTTSRAFLRTWPAILHWAIRFPTAITVATLFLVIIIIGCIKLIIYIVIFHELSP